MSQSAGFFTEVLDLITPSLEGLDMIAGPAPQWTSYTKDIIPNPYRVPILTDGVVPHCAYCGTPAREHKHSGKCLSCGAPVNSDTPQRKNSDFGPRLYAGVSLSTTHVPENAPLYVSKDELYSLRSHPCFLPVSHVNSFVRGYVSGQVGYYLGNPVVLRD